MNFRDVEYIVKIAECGSINKAARELYVAQPSLSKCIKKVEDEYDIQLFYRNPGSSISLTVAGQAFLDMARPVLQLYRHFDDQIKEIKKRGRSRIVLGTAAQRGYDISSVLFKKLYLEYDEYLLELRTDKSLELEKGLLNGDLDMILITTGNFRDELYYERLYDTNQFVYLRRGSPAAAKAIHMDGIRWPVIRLEDLEGELIVANARGSANREFMDEMMERYGLDFEIVERGNNGERMAMVESGRASYFLNIKGDRLSEKYNQELMYYIHPDQQISGASCLICRKGFEHDERFKIVWEALKELEDKNMTKYR